MGKVFTIHAHIKQIKDEIGKNNLKPFSYDILEFITDMEDTIFSKTIDRYNLYSMINAYSKEKNYEMYYTNKYGYTITPDHYKFSYQILFTIKENTFIIVLKT